MLRQIGETTDLPYAPLVCEEAYLLAGCVEEAHRLGERGLAHAREHKTRGQEARALWLLGEIARHGNPPDVAQVETYYQQALTLAEELGMRPLQAHCHLGLGTLYATTGQREPTRAALATAIALYRALDMSFWLPGGSGAGACRVAGAACLALTVIVIAASLDRPLATHYALRM